MKFTIFALVTLGVCLGNILPGRSQQASPANSIEPSQVTREQVLTACVQERAETLPQLYSDVPPNHWAFKAVQTIAYCGAYRSATPPALIEELLNSGNNDPPDLGDRILPSSLE